MKKILLISTLLINLSNTNAFAFSQDLRQDLREARAKYEKEQAEIEKAGKVDKVKILFRSNPVFEIMLTRYIELEGRKVKYYYYNFPKTFEEVQAYKNPTEKGLTDLAKKYKSSLVLIGTESGRLGYAAIFF